MKKFKSLTVTNRARFLKWSPLFVILLVFGLMAHFHLFHYLRISSLKTYQSTVVQWAQQNYTMAVALYIIVFTLMIACAVPCATILTLIGGFLFGGIAALYAIAATTFGGLLLFLAVRTAIGERIAAKRKSWIKRLEAGFQKNAFQYILTLRLIPIFPCWISNISAGLLNVPMKTFLLATVIGITPSTFIYAMAGRSLDKLISTGQTSFSTLLLTPSILVPLLGLAFLSIFPILYKTVKKWKQPR